MTEQAFFSDNYKGVLTGTYWLHGAEPYSRHRAVRAVIDRVDEATREMNVSRMKAASYGDIVNACESLPFFADRRVVILEDTPADVLTALKDNVAQFPESTLLLIVQPGAGDKKNPLFKLLGDQNRTVSFDVFDEGRAGDFVVKRAKENGIPVERAAVRMLVAYLGTDLGGLENALLMLGDYVGRGNTVTVEAVKTCITPIPEYQIFALLDGLIAGNRAEAVAQLIHMEKTGADTPIRFAVFLEGRVKQMLTAKQMMELGRSEQAIVQALRGSPYAAKKTVQNARKCTMEQLIGALTDLSRVDLYQKKGVMKDSEALLLAVLRNFQEGRNRT